MTNSFWFSNDGDVVTPPAVEPPYNVEESVRFDGEDNKLSRTPAETDGQRLGETGNIQTVAFNEDGSVTLTVADGLEPHQDLQGDYLQVGDTLTQDSAGTISTSAITTASTPYVIGQSVIFDGSSSYLNRTPSSASNQKTFTWSGWVKRTELGGNKTFFSSANSGTSGPRTDWQFWDDTLYITFNPTGSTWLSVGTNRVFRDPSVWHHIVIAVDTTQAVNDDRVKIYVDGVRETSFSIYDTFTQNIDLHINSTAQHAIGRYEAANGNNFPGYLADVQLVDGVALDASAFGEYNSDGVWVPKEADLTRLSPYDTRSIANEDWSGDGTIVGAVNNSWERAFNGDLNNGVFTYSSNASTITLPSGVNWNKKIEVFALRYDGSLFINGQDITNQINWASPAAPGEWYDLTDILGSSGTLTSIGLSDEGTNYVMLSAVRIDGRLMVDGPWDNSQNWSEYLTSPSGWVHPTSRAFDGDLSTTTAAKGDATLVTFTSPVAFPSGSTLEIYGMTNPAGSFTVSVNGGSGQSVSGGDFRTITYSPGDESAFVITIQNDAATANTDITGIRIGGKLLVDSGAQWNTDRVWSKNVGGFSFRLNEAFDGDPTTYAQAYSGVTTSILFEYNGQDAIAATESVEVHPDPNFSGSTDVVYQVFTTSNPGAAAYSVTISDNSPFIADSSNWSNEPITKITARGLNEGARVSMVKIDGEVLIDGGYGYNGFHLDFSSTDLGEDSGGSGNDWTANNLEALSGTFPGSVGLTTYTGDAGLTVTVDGFGFSPDLIWIKNLTSAQDHCLYDTLRGVDRNQLNSNRTYQEAGNLGETGGVTSTTSDGFVLTGDNTINGGTNSADTFSAWCWDAGTSAPAAASGGSIATTNKNNGLFAINTWSTPAGTGNIDTGLPSADFVIIKSRNTTGDWYVWHKDMSNSSGLLILNSANTQTINSDVFAGGGSASDGLVSLGALGNPNASMVAYSWYESAGLTKFGSYTGNGTFSGATQTIDLGFTPAVVIIKAVTVQENWIAFDSSRPGKYRNPNTANTDVSTTKLEIVDGGFRVTGSEAEWNDPNNNYIYAAWSAEVVKVSDKTIDSPIGFINAAGDAVGNYATLDPLLNSKFQSKSLSNGNLTFDGNSSAGSGYPTTFSTISVNSGKFYVEAEVQSTTDSAGAYFGVCDAQMTGTGIAVANTFPGGPGGTAYGANGRIDQNNVQIASTDTYTEGDVIGIAYDADSAVVRFYKNGVSVSDPISVVVGTRFFVFGAYENRGLTVNFGQKPWAHTPPAGYKSLCLTNL